MTSPTASVRSTTSFPTASIPTSTPATWPTSSGNSPISASASSATANRERTPTMGTRAVYTFIDQDDSFSVYMHWDGYPYGACRLIAKAFPLAWPLPRFEADEFAAAFVAANKQQPGNIRLTSGPEAPGDLAYTYEI